MSAGGALAPAPRRRSRGRRSSARAARRRVARGNRAAVDRDAAHGRARAVPALPPHGASTISADGPERRLQPRPSSVSAHSARGNRVMVVEGMIVPADDLARSHDPCRRSPARRPLRSSAIAGAIGLGAVADLDRPRAAGQDLARGSRAGSSLRGLSSVTMATIGELRGDRAHLRALAVVAIAAAAEHHERACLRT